MELAHSFTFNFECVKPFSGDSFGYGQGLLSGGELKPGGFELIAKARGCHGGVIDTLYF